MGITPRQCTCDRCKVALSSRGAQIMEIRLARHGGHIAIVSIDNGPRLNAMTRQMLSKLGALWDELDRDLTCRCIILTGVGQRAFTVGADISGDLSAGPETARMVNHALLKNDAYSKPIVAAVRSLGGEVLGDERCVRRR